jgi:hypothetical protein
MARYGLETVSKGYVVFAVWWCSMEAWVTLHVWCTEES